MCPPTALWRSVPSHDRGFDDEMRNVVASNLAGRGIKLHPERNPVKASIPYCLPPSLPSLPCLILPTPYPAGCCAQWFSPMMLVWMKCCSYAISSMWLYPSDWTSSHDIATLIHCHFFHLLVAIKQPD